MEANIMLWLVIATCCWWNSMSSLSPTFLRSIVNESAPADQVPKIEREIRGPNAYCIDIQQADYSDGTPAILSPCNSRANQKWSFDYEGTITSKGKCLVTQGYSQGSNTVINNCDTAAKDSKLWKLRYNGDTGVIVHQKTGLALTAILGQKGTRLTIQRNIFSSYQTWATNNPGRRGGIFGLNGLCLQVSSKSVLLEKCDIFNNPSYRYPDGTIRLYDEKGKTWRCLSYNNLVGKRVVVESCGLAPSSERWVFTSDGTILNERASLVVEAKDLNEIIVNSPTGDPNQKWEWRNFL